MADFIKRPERTQKLHLELGKLEREVEEREAKEEQKIAE